MEVQFHLRLGCDFFNQRRSHLRMKDQLDQLEYSMWHEMSDMLKKERGSLPPKANRLLKFAGLYIGMGAKWRTPCFDLCLGKMVLAASSVR